MREHLTRRQKKAKKLALVMMEEAREKILLNIQNVANFQDVNFDPTIKLIVIGEIDNYIKWFKESKMPDE